MRSFIPPVFVKIFRLSAVASLSVLAVLVSHTSSALPNHATYDEIIARGTLQVVVYEDFPPFSSRLNGELVGVDIDIARRIAEKMGITAEFRELAAGENVDDDLRNAIWKGHYIDNVVSDLMMHVPTDREFARRNNMVVIMGNYYKENLVMARNLEKTGETPTLAVYRFEKVGVELDSLPDFFLSGYLNGILRNNVVHFSTVHQAAEALVNTEIAAVFAPKSQLEDALGDNAIKFDIGKVAAPELVKSNWNLGVAVSAHTRQLGYAIEDILAEMLANGEIAGIFSRYGLTHSQPER